MVSSLRTALDDARSEAIPIGPTLSSSRSVLALGRFEARRMMVHPSFWVGMVFGLLLSRGALGVGQETDLVRNLAWILMSLAFGMLVGSVLTANVATLRARRDDMGELYGSLPAPPETRTMGILVGLLMGPVAVAAITAAIAWPILVRISELAEHIDLFLAVQLPLSVAALGTVGIAVGRWVPSVLGGPIVVVLHVMTPIVWAAPWILPTTTDVGVAWHLTYLVVAIVAWSATALARDRRTAARFAVAGVAFALGIFALVQQTPPGGY